MLTIYVCNPRQGDIMLRRTNNARITGKRIAGRKIVLNLGVKLGIDLAREVSTGRLGGRHRLITAPGEGDEGNKNEGE